MAGSLLEPVVNNLCVLYDLQTDLNNHKKKMLQSMVIKYKGDDFPISRCFKAMWASLPSWRHSTKNTKSDMLRK